MKKELAASAVVEHEEEFAVALERIIHLDDERVSNIFLQSQFI